jgi:hypothetical protein
MGHQDAQLPPSSGCNVDEALWVKVDLPQGGDPAGPVQYPCLLISVLSQAASTLQVQQHFVTSGKRCPP